MTEETFSNKRDEYIYKALTEKSEETLSDKIQQGLIKRVLWSEDVKDFIKKLIQIAEDNDWEVATDEGQEDGFKVISGKDYIELKAGKELIE